MKALNKILGLLPTLAAALMLTACSSEDNTTENAQTPTEPTTTAKTIHYTVSVSNGGDATTRATVESDNKTLHFATGDKLYITGTDISGVLDIQAGDGTTTGPGTANATFEGDLTYTGTDPTTPAADLALTATLVSAEQFASLTTASPLITVDAAGAVTVNYPTTAFCDDVATAVQKYSNLTGTSTYSAKNFTLEQKTAFLNFAITFNDGTATATNITTTVKNGSTTLSTATVTTATVSGKVMTKFVLPVDATATLSGAKVVLEGGQFDFTKPFGGASSKALTGKVYNITRNTATILSEISANYEAQDGDFLTGTLGGNYKISIASGATVTLHDVTINGTDESSYNWAGITCDNDATLIISGTNTVKGFYAHYPGIYIASGKTLTIQGTGSLDAICGAGDGKAGGAGIGGGASMDCGNIVINSGTITATAGKYSAGIGGGSLANCGNITINGGNITATGRYNACGIGSGRGTSANISCGTITITGGTVNATGGYEAAGIGSGAGKNSSPYDYKASCGAISISGTANVTATGGDGGGAGIGGGNCSDCSTIDISGGTVSATGQSLASGIGCGREESTCGAITITSDVTSVTATKGGDSETATSIGKNGWSSTTCGTVTIGGVVYWDGSAYQNSGDDASTGLKHSPYVYAPSN